MNLCYIYYFILLGGKNLNALFCSSTLPRYIHSLSAAICYEILGYMLSKSNFKGCDSGMRGERKV